MRTKVKNNSVSEINRKISYLEALILSRNLPLMTTAERDATENPREGTVIYNFTTKKLNLRTDAAWEEITSA